MSRTAVGKPTVLMPIRVDEDVRAALLGFKESHASINAGLREVLLGGSMLSSSSKSMLSGPGIEESDIENEILAARASTGSHKCRHCPGRFDWQRGAPFGICPACTQDGHYNLPGDCPRCSEGQAI